MEQYVEEISIHNEDFNTGIDDLLKSLDSDDNKKSIAILEDELEDANVGILDVANKMIKFQEDQLEKVKQESYLS